MCLKLKSSVTSLLPVNVFNPGISISVVYNSESVERGFLRNSLYPVAQRVASPSVANSHTGPTLVAVPVIS